MPLAALVTNTIAAFQNDLGRRSKEGGAPTNLTPTCRMGKGGGLAASHPSSIRTHGSLWLGHRDWRAAAGDPSAGLSEGRLAVVQLWRRAERWLGRASRSWWAGRRFSLPAEGGGGVAQPYIIRVPTSSHNDGGSE